MTRSALHPIRSWSVFVWFATASVAPACAGVLVEAELEGVPVRLELALPGEAARDALLVSVNGRRLLVAPAQGRIEPLDGARDASLAARAPKPQSFGSGLELRRLAGGAVVAGHAGFYHLALFGERICAEVLAAPWMAEPLRPAAAALDLLAHSEPALAPKARHGCPAFSFLAWTEAGWPLLVSGRDATMFRTKAIRFDHPLPPELAAEPRP